MDGTGGPQFEALALGSSIIPLGSAIMPLPLGSAIIPLGSAIWLAAGEGVAPPPGEQAATMAPIPSIATTIATRERRSTACM